MSIFKKYDQTQTMIERARVVSTICGTWLPNRSTCVEQFADTVREASVQEKCSFFIIVQKAVDPPLSFEHYVVNFSEGILTKVRKRLSRQLSTKKHVNLW